MPGQIGDLQRVEDIQQSAGEIATNETQDVTRLVCHHGAVEGLQSLAEDQFVGLGHELDHCAACVPALPLAEGKLPLAGQPGQDKPRHHHERKCRERDRCYPERDHRKLLSMARLSRTCRVPL
jgi:hypothetical protein